MLQYARAYELSQSSAYEYRISSTGLISPSPSSIQLQVTPSTTTTPQLPGFIPSSSTSSLRTSDSPPCSSNLPSSRHPPSPCRRPRNRWSDPIPLPRRGGLESRTALNRWYDIQKGQFLGDVLENAKDRIDKASLAREHRPIPAPTTRKRRIQRSRISQPEDSSELAEPPEGPQEATVIVSKRDQRRQVCGTIVTFSISGRRPIGDLKILNKLNKIEDDIGSDRRRQSQPFKTYQEMPRRVGFYPRSKNRRQFGVSGHFRKTADIAKNHG